MPVPRWIHITSRLDPTPLRICTVPINNPAAGPHVRKENEHQKKKKKRQRGRPISYSIKEVGYIPSSIDIIVRFIQPTFIRSAGVFPKQSICAPYRTISTNMLVFQGIKKLSPTRGNFGWGKKNQKELDARDRKSQDPTEKSHC